MHAYPPPMRPVCPSICMRACATQRWQLRPCPLHQKHTRALHPIRSSPPLLCCGFAKACLPAWRVRSAFLRMLACMHGVLALRAVRYALHYIACSTLYCIALHGMNDAAPTACMHAALLAVWPLAARWRAAWRACMASTMLVMITAISRPPPAAQLCADDRGSSAGACCGRVHGPRSAGHMQQPSVHPRLGGGHEMHACGWPQPDRREAEAKHAPCGRALMCVPRRLEILCPSSRNKVCGSGHAWGVCGGYLSYLHKNLP